MCFLSTPQVLEEFYNIFGPELKAVTGDPKRIEDVLKRVDALVKPIEEVTLYRICSSLVQTLYHGSTMMW